MKPIIRKATLDDLPTLLQFEQGIVKAERPFNRTLKDGVIHYYDIAAMIDDPAIAVVVAVCDNQLIGSGFARIDKAKSYLKHAHHAWLGFMYVVPEYRGRGVNKLIVDALTQWAVEQGITEFRLDVYSDNEAAIRAYEKSGFTRHLTEMRMNVKEQ